MKTVVIALCSLLTWSLFAQHKNIPLQDPYDVFPLFYKGIESAADGKWDTAHRQFQTVVNKVSWHLDAALYLTICEDVRGKRIKPNSARNVFQALNTISNGQDTSRALHQINRMISAHSDYFAFSLIRAKIYEKLANPEQAIPDFERAVALKPDYALSYHFRGRFLSDMNRRDEALQDFHQTLRLHPRHLPTLVRRGILYAELDSLQSAYEDLKLAMHISAIYTKDFWLVDIFNRVGLYHFARQNNVQAVEAFDWAIEVDDTWSEPFLNRGIAERNQNAYTRAIADFDQAIALDSTLASAYYHRALAHKANQNLQAAERDLQTSAHWEATDPRIYQNLGELYFAQGRDDEAILAFKKVQQFDENDRWANYWIGFALDRQKDYRRAIHYYRAFLEAPPPDAARFIKRIQRRAEQINQWIIRENQAGIPKSP
jgi:tetratricopeptide (TPR) repeat protein